MTKYDYPKLLANADLSGLTSSNGNKISPSLAKSILLAVWANEGLTMTYRGLAARAGLRLVTVAIVLPVLIAEGYVVSLGVGQFKSYEVRVPTVASRQVREPIGGLKRGRKIRDRVRDAAQVKPKGKAARHGRRPKVR